MEFNDGKIILKKDKFNLIIIQAVLLILSLIFGGILVLGVLKYLNNISILNTFFIILYMYFFQLLIEFGKYFMLYLKCNNSNKNIINFIKNFKSKFFVINFCMFSLFSLIIFGCLLCSLFFSSFEILFIFVMGVSLGMVYLFYTVELFKVVDSKFKINFEVLKNNKQNTLIIVLINALIIILLSNVFYFFNYLGVIIFVFITLVNLILVHVDYIYLRKNIKIDL